jgi:5-oxopent-3-ene-1,2,5-tricarboxylate decarboxylase / 2-hydroxyhepta-2,4-diene-1,7-dioate isomerase
MSVLEGPKRELRHIVYRDNSSYWANYRDGEMHLVDGHVVLERASAASATVRADQDPLHPPQRSLASFTNSRVRTSHPPPTPTYFLKPITALNAHGGELVRTQAAASDK